MIYNTQDYRVFALCPSSEILMNELLRKLDLFSFLGKRVRGTYSVGSILKSEPQSLELSLALSNGPNRAGTSHPPPEDKNNPVSKPLCSLEFPYSFLFFISDKVRTL
jgi:hypothetical protein